MKAMLLVGNRPILARELAALRTAGFDDVALVGRWTLDERPLAPVIADAVVDAGALGGLYTALLTGSTETVLVLAGDMPFVGAPLLHRLTAIAEGDDAVVPRTSDGLHPLCACYRRRVARRIKARLDAGSLGIRDALMDMRVQEIAPDELAALDPDGMMLMNVNTPGEYERACQVAAAGGEHRA